MRVMGLDIGDRRIGVALSDPGARIAQPYATIDRNKENAIERLQSIVKENDVGVIVVGLPLNMNGSEGIQAERTRAFVNELREAIPDVDLTFRDERLTSVASENVLIESGMRREKRKKHRDRVAATLILQNYLESENLRTDS